MTKDRDAPSPRKKLFSIEDLIRSHAELRAVLTLAGKRIKQQAIGRQDDELLKKMREVYAEARAIARQFEHSAKKP